jgi:hypothetical protein
MNIEQQLSGKRSRSKAWVYYALLAFGNFIVAVTSSPAALLAVLICALYSLYLYRGGRFVLWIW